MKDLGLKTPTLCTHIGCVTSGKSYDLLEVGLDDLVRSLPSLKTHESRK